MVEGWRGMCGGCDAVREAGSGLPGKQLGIREPIEDAAIGRHDGEDHLVGAVGSGNGNPVGREARSQRVGLGLKAPAGMVGRPGDLEGAAVE